MPPQLAGPSTRVPCEGRPRGVSHRRSTCESSSLVIAGALLLQSRTCWSLGMMIGRGTCSLSHVSLGISAAVACSYLLLGIQTCASYRMAAAVVFFRSQSAWDGKMPWWQWQRARAVNASVLELGKRQRICQRVSQQLCRHCLAYGICSAGCSCSRLAIDGSHAENGNVWLLASLETIRALYCLQVIYAMSSLVPLMAACAWCQRLRSRFERDARQRFALQPSPTH